MAVYDGFFDAVMDDETGEYDRTYESGDFTEYFSNIIGTGVCVHNDPDSFKVRLEEGRAVVGPGYLFIQGYWLKNDADYPIDLPGTGNYAIVAHLNLGKRMIELEARSVSQAYPDSLVLAIVSPTAAEDTRHNTDICGVIDTAGELSKKVEWAVNYIDTEIESKLDQVEQDINAQAAKLDAKIAEVQAVADSIVPPPIGSIKFSASQDVGEEWLRCDGSFINEAQYPELVAALGKLIPSGDKFQIISSGEVGPQITNGVVYGGRLWVYSYSAKKLYGVDLEGTAAVKEIALISEDPSFNDFIIPSNASPLALSIVPHLSGTGAALFLAQVTASGSKAESWNDYFLIFSAEFSGDGETLLVSKPFSTVGRFDFQGSILFEIGKSVPYVVSHTTEGIETYICATGAMTWLEWAAADGEAKCDRGGFSVSDMFSGQRCAYSAKNRDEIIGISSNETNLVVSRTLVYSFPNGTFSTDGYKDGGTYPPGRISPLPLTIAGNDRILTAFDKNSFPWISFMDFSAGEAKPGIPPSAARVFVDGGAYLWGKDIFMIFVGTGIVFSRGLTEGSFGYLDTTSVLGTITQFGYLGYSEDEGTLYLLGQDTTNTVKAAKITLNTLYDYANDGAWLPMIASDGVPAYIKAKEKGSGAIVDPVGMQVTVSFGGYFADYAELLFNGEIMRIAGTYTKTVSGGGTFTVGLRIKNSTNITPMGVYLNNSLAASLPTGSPVGTVSTETFKTSDFISGGIKLEGRNKT